jgi:diamine N-acetyltransferase
VAKVYGGEQQAREIGDPAIVTLLAEDGQLIGFVQLRLGASIEIARFYVDGRWQGHGVAHELMRAVEDEARRRGIATIWLGVWERNARAIAFYAKCGFEITGSHPFLLGGDLQTDLEMTKTVSPRA